MNPPDDQPPDPVPDDFEQGDVIEVMKGVRKEISSVFLSFFSSIPSFFPFIQDSNHFISDVRYVSISYCDRSTIPTTADTLVE